ncbi:hypothetical protein [Methanolobus chelungpuianus]|uniref:Uncharacterized protein n=1 Tax=Methanolobus chelungpuianus TaxID=502115 RepID=A0AAE3HD22_9EURY|nr:hypothetical protein [Methanolobus chelungpuianus]MCQ6963343.1 hypothetical protein [Methanolobus chelungpuianus]
MGLERQHDLNNNEDENTCYPKKAPPGYLDDLINKIRPKDPSSQLEMAHRKVFSILAIVLLASMMFILMGYTLPSADLSENIVNSSYTAVPLKASGEHVALINNESADDPTWNELISFLKADDTDRVIYDENSSVSPDFAERLHNNAEKAGIRAAFVVVDFYDNDEVYALNAFKTTDKGLTYVDCTGSDVKLQELDSFDKIAYVEKGKKYGIISIYYTNSPEYEFYKSRKNHFLRRGFYEEKGYVDNINVCWEST